MSSSTNPGPDGYARAQRIMDLLRWAWLFVYVQFLFVAGTLAGLVVGGVFPAFFAAVFVARQLGARDGADFATRRFIELYRRTFWKCQKVGWTMAFIALVCFSNIVYFNQLQATRPWAFVVKIGWLVATFVVMTTLTLVAPTVVDYDLPLRRLPRLALTGLSDLPSLVAIWFWTGCLVAGLYLQTGLFLYVAIGIFIFLVAYCSRQFELRKVVVEWSAGQPAASS